MGKTGFITKDSGKRVEFKTGMQRDVNSDKPRFDLITPDGLPFEERLLTRWARLMERGASKYGERNWEKASTEEEKKRFMDSAYRHFMQWAAGETDEDHAAAVFFNISGAEMVDLRLKYLNKTSLDEAIKDFRKTYPQNPATIFVNKEEPDKRLTPKEAAVFMGVSLTCLNQYVRDGLIPAEIFSKRNKTILLSNIKASAVYQTREAYKQRHKKA
jgi:Domain of unknown function (DUF5664)